MSNKVFVRKLIKVEYGHQLFTSYTDLCHETIHGHSGVIEIIMSSQKLNDDQMVMDFGELKDTVKKQLMEKYDHALFMPKQFPSEYLDMLKKYNKRLTITDVNPTCEVFAKMIFDEVKESLAKINPNVKLEYVKFHETDTGYAEYGESQYV